MRRPVLWCVLSFLLGALATWRLMGARPAPATAPRTPEPPAPPRTPHPGSPGGAARTEAAPDEPWYDETPTGQIPVQSRESASEVTRVSGTLEDALSARSAPAGPDGAAPSNEYTVKAADGVFHTTESPAYPAVVATVWFRTAADAHEAGFTPWHA